MKWTTLRANGTSGHFRETWAPQALGHRNARLVQRAQDYWGGSAALRGIMRPRPRRQIRWNRQVDASGIVLILALWCHSEIFEWLQIVTIVAKYAFPQTLSWVAEPVEATPFHWSIHWPNTMCLCLLCMQHDFETYCEGYQEYLHKLTKTHIISHCTPGLNWPLGKMSPFFNPRSSARPRPTARCAKRRHLKSMLGLDEPLVLYVFVTLCHVNSQNMWKHVKPCFCSGRCSRGSLTRLF